MKDKKKDISSKAKKQIMEVVLGSICIILVLTIIICAGCIARHSRNQSNYYSYQLSQTI